MMPNMPCTRERRRKSPESVREAIVRMDYGNVSGPEEPCQMTDEWHPTDNQFPTAIDRGVGRRGVLNLEPMVPEQASPGPLSAMDGD